MKPRDYFIAFICVICFIVAFALAVAMILLGSD